MIDFFNQYPEYWSDWLVRLLQGAKVSAELSLTGFSIAAVLGSLLVWALKSPFATLRQLAKYFIQAMRAVPLLALLLALYFALPNLHLTLSGYWAGALGPSHCLGDLLADAYFSVGRVVLFRYRFSAVDAVACTGKALFTRPQKHSRLNR